MKKLLIILLVGVFITACSGNDETEKKTNSTENDNNQATENIETEDEQANDDDKDKATKKESEETETNKNSSNETSSNDDSDKSNNQSEDKKDNALSKYTSEEIEYTRVWLQVIDNQETEELNVWHYSAGEQVNPYDDDSIDYPEDVIALGGKISADGVVTYSGNGDGTINLYEIPSHWPSSEQVEQSENQSMKEYTEEIIENPEKVRIDSDEDKKVEELIKKLNIIS